MKDFDLKKYLKEGKLHEINQPYEVISKKTKQSEFGDKPFYDMYVLKINEEDYTTPEGLTFKLLTKGNVMIDKGETLDFDNPTHYFYYIVTIVFGDDEKELEEIPGRVVYGTYDAKASINKAKRWLDKRGSKLLGGIGYQHKST